MSRWGRGRGGSVAVPLDSALFRENSNCPTASRSAGTVGKWGITSFTSIRNSPYAFTSNTVKKPVQDQNSPLTVPAVDTEQPPPKPKKFFKSRNVDPLPSVPQITYAPPVSAAPLSPEHSYKRETKRRAKAAYSRDSSSPESPKRGSDKVFKGRKGGFGSKAAKKDNGLSDESKPPNKRYLVRNRNKVINYAEDGSNSPIPDIASTYIPPPPSKIASPKPSPPAPVVSSPTYAKPGIASPTPKDSSDERPPIVLRISKGTSRIVSTDSNEGFTSPGSDRHSSMDTHGEFGQDQHKSPSVDSIRSPKHEGLKITIKCSSLNDDKKGKKKDKKDGHKSHKRHHKSSDDEPLKKAASPLPGSDNYDLYKTLASPVGSDEPKKDPYDDIESQLAKLDEPEQEYLKSPSSEMHKRNAPSPEPKPPETSTGRSRRNRPNINYSENDDYLDALTSGRSKHVKPIVEPKKETTTRRTRKRIDAIAAELAPSIAMGGKDSDSHEEKNDLLDILSGNEPQYDNDSLRTRSRRNKPRECNKNSPDYPTDLTMDAIEEHSQTSEATSEAKSQEEIDSEHTENMDNISEKQGISQISSEQTTDTAYNSGSNEVSEEEANRNTQDDVFKSPRGLSEGDIVAEDKPSVKLVITKKKGSIFKSKSLMNDNPSPLPARKRRHLYRHEWANDGKGNETPRREPEIAENPDVGATKPVSEDLTRITRYRTPDPNEDTDSIDAVKPYTSVRCAKEAKEYYTVVRNVKKAHQIQEIGEFQEFNDDVEYLLDALQDNNPMSTRCLSAITLASKCTAPAFRMHLRAHGTVQKFFSALHDATNDVSLGLCTATVMFVLSQDRLNMDVDRESLELMLNLLESDVSHKNALDDCGLTSSQLAKTQERVRELCAEIKSQGKAKHLDLDNITVGHLAMETLLSLTSKRAGEWFKEELRVLGGVDHIVRTIQDCAERLMALTTPATMWGGADIDVLRKADRCMRVLENVTQQNEDNQLYLVSGPRVGVAGTLGALLALCVRESASCTLAIQGPLLDAALPALKVLVNLSHSFGLTASLGANVVGEEVTIMEICLVILRNQRNFVPDDRNFEFNVCVLLLLINLVQNNPMNTERLLSLRINVDEKSESKMPSLDLIIEHFYKREELAKAAEENTDAILDGDEKEKEDDKEKKKQSQDDIDETVAKLLARAGAHMEHSMVGAYAALLLGHVAIVSPLFLAKVRVRVPAFALVLPTLKKYYAFLALTASGEASIVAHVKSTQRIIDFMEASDRDHSQETSQQPKYDSRDSISNYPNSYQDMPQDMSLSSLTYNCSGTSSSDRMSSSMEIDNYH